MNESDKKKLDDLMDELLKRHTREEILQALGITNIQAEMKRVDAVSENKGKISL
jgi:hypothetical protein